MAPEDGGTGGGRSTAAGGGGQVLKKGPWTAAEDGILMEYVKKHGEGNWNAVQRNSGLMRCGKSCRLRWANHLRPNLKKGAFTPEEERQIIELHSKFGNKWARMALHLPGRTDNEIKNYWNTRLKRRQRAGLPIYPTEFQQHHHHHQRRHHEPPLQNQMLPFTPSSRHKNTSLNLIDPMNYPMINASLSCLPNSQSHFKLLRNNNGGTALSLPSSSSNLQFATSQSSMPIFNQGLQSFNYSMINQAPTMEASFNDVRLSENFENELPSIQSSFQAITPTSSSNTVNDHMVVPSSDGDNYENTEELCPIRNSGLLGDVLGESRALLSSRMCHNEEKPSEDDKGKSKMAHDYALLEEHDAVNLESVFGLRDNDTMRLEDSSSGHSSIEIGLKSQTDMFDEINMMDDDFSSWLDFPVTGPLQDLYGGISDDASTEKPAEVSGGNMAATDHRLEVSCSPVATTLAETDHDWTSSSCCWNNMPGFS